MMCLSGFMPKEHLFALLYEMSTPVLNIRSCMLDLRKVMKRSDFEARCSGPITILSWVLLAVYTVFRVALGLPLTVHILLTMWFHNPTAACVPAFPAYTRYISAIPIILSFILNFAWWCVILSVCFAPFLGRKPPTKEKKDK